MRQDGFKFRTNAADYNSGCGNGLADGPILLYTDSIACQLGKKAFSMSEVQQETGPQQQKSPAPAKPAAPVDLSAELALALDKSVGDQIRCTRVTSDTYRCNWWAAFTTNDYDNPKMSGLLVTTHRVRKSQFLHVTKTNGKLVISEKRAVVASAD